MPPPIPVPHSPPPAARRAFIATALLLAGSALAEVSEHLDYSTYEVPAHRGGSLRESLNEATPIHEGGRAFHADTRWHVAWHFHYRERASGGCEITDVATTLTATILLPGPSDPDLARSAAFTTYLAALKRHEHGHVQIGRDAAAAIDAGIMALPSQGDCEAMGSAANAFAQGQLARSREIEIRYDADTGYGRSQGAYLD